MIRTPTGTGAAIAEYALLSDCRSTALVHRSGSVDWACFRRFDSPSTFGRLLDPHAGHFSIVPRGEIVELTRRYIDATMVLETTMRTATGTMVLIDALSVRPGGASDTSSRLLRRVRCTAGTVDIAIDLSPRFDYGAVHPWIRRHADDRVSAVGGDAALVVHASCQLEIDQSASRITGGAALAAGETVDIVLLAEAAHLLVPEAVDVSTLGAELDVTLSWWTNWSSRSDAVGPHADLIERSALVLKSLCCAPTGAIIAAPTTSLPEIPGGTKNWDYRYCWIRDATLTLQALSATGHHDVSQGFRDFVMRSSAGRGDELQIMYGAYGERRLPEVELDHLAGWRDSRPVRIGNGAAAQTQLDVYGHLLDAAHLWHEHAMDDDFEIPDAGIDEDEWRFLASVVDCAVARRNDTDAGIWELRGPGQHYVYSKVMVWVAIDRGIRLVEQHGLQIDGDRLSAWRTARDEVRAAVESNGVDPAGGNFVQCYGSTDVDASLLKLALVGFVEPGDPRMIATVEAVRAALATGPHGLLRRFVGDGDGQSGSAGDGGRRHEGIFLLCSFWLVEVLAVQGRLGEATEMFDTLCSLANDVGLLAEEFDTTTGELLGNFPQAFTHLGLIAADSTLRGQRGEL